MRWEVCMKNLEAGKMVLITPDMKVDCDDPRFGDEVHVVPVVPHPTEPDTLSFGVHDFTRDCACHPKVEHEINRRIMIVHSERVN